MPGCEQGPAQKAGEKPARRSTGPWDRLSGKGPVEKAGERIDKAAEELEK